MEVKSVNPLRSNFLSHNFVLRNERLPDLTALRAGSCPETLDLLTKHGVILTVGTAHDEWVEKRSGFSLQHIAAPRTNLLATLRTKGSAHGQSRPSPGEPIPGYRLIERLGGGGFGEVWKAEAPGGLLKAIKFVYGDLQGNRRRRRPGPSRSSRPSTASRRSAIPSSCRWNASTSSTAS